MKFQQWVRRTFFSSPKDHDKRVQRIQSLVRRWSELPADQRKPMCTAKPNWLSLSTTFFKKVLSDITKMSIACMQCFRSNATKYPFPSTTFWS